MNTSSINASVRTEEIGMLLRGEVESISAWSKVFDLRRFGLHMLIIILGSGIYGATMGWWRDPQQALFVALKFPLIILMTACGNALINGMFAPLLGLNISFRQSFSVIVMSYTIASAILGAFSPLIAFVLWNSPSMTAKALSTPTYNFIILTHVAVIALAGSTGNVRLLQLLTQLSRSRDVARRVLVAWLSVNFLLGSQLSWILRPFIGSPDLPVEFFRKAALHGNFFESVFHAIGQFI